MSQMHAPVCIARTERWALSSTRGRVFEISIAAPRLPPTARGYSVAYVLDPTTAFATLVDTMRNQEELFGPVLVVGVGYVDDDAASNRTFDLTPYAEPALSGPVGGADQFLEFLRHDLQPAIAARFAVDRDRQAIFGHSLGGLFVLYALAKRPDTFGVYIACSPSLWWGDGAWFNELTGLEQRMTGCTGRRRVLIAIGGLESDVNPEERRAAQKEGIENLPEMKRRNRMVERAASCADALRRLQTSGLDTTFVQFEGETHRSVIPAYLGRGARFALNGWFA